MWSINKICWELKHYCFPKIYIPNYSRTFALCIIKHIFYICRPFSKLHSRFFLFTSVWIRAEYGSNRHQIASVISEQTRPEQPEGVVIEMKYIRYYYFGYLLSITSQYDQRKEWKNTNINLMYSPRLPQQYPSILHVSFYACWTFNSGPPALEFAPNQSTSEQTINENEAAKLLKIWSTFQKSV